MISAKGVGDMGRVGAGLARGGVSVRDRVTSDGGWNGVRGECSRI